MHSRSERLIAAFARGLVSALTELENESGGEGRATQRPARKAARKRTRAPGRALSRQKIQTPLSDNVSTADPENELLASAKSGIRSGEVTTEDLYTMDDVENFLRTIKTKSEPTADTYNPDADPEEKKVWVAPS